MVGEARQDNVITAGLSHNSAIRTLILMLASYHKLMHRNTEWFTDSVRDRRAATCEG